MDWLSYVNVNQGTRSDEAFSHGSTLPLTQLPFGMNAFSPQTRSNSGNWFFHPDDRSLEGIRLTHQPSPWMGDYASLTLLPQRECFYSGAAERRSFVHPEKLRQSPAELDVFFERYQCRFQLVPTERGARIRLTFSGQEDGALSLFTKSDAGFSLSEDGRTLLGSTNEHTWQVAENFKMYFALRFSCAAVREKCSFSDTDAYVVFPNQSLEVQLAVSYLSHEQALVTLQRETKMDYEQLRETARDVWEEHLRRVELSANTPEDLCKCFYSCLYRVFLYPHRFFEVSANGEVLHRCPDTGNVCSGVRYVDNGFWDTFRTIYPLLSILAPREEQEILQGFLNAFRECGWLPKWSSPAEAGVMPGTLIEAVLADAAVKGLLSAQQLDLAVRAAVKNASGSAPAPYGRRGVEDYQALGYLPCNKFKESVSQTLDSMYGDFCIAQLLLCAGHRQEAEDFLKTAGSYSALFDPTVGFMRGKDSNGVFWSPFSPYSWGGAYCEGGAWQSSFAAYHDYDGLAELYGGKEKLIEKLDLLFNTPPRYEVGSYRQQIHEMAEMAAADLGQCAISNQPSFHIPWMFAELDAPEKTEYWLQRICSECFSWRSGGFPGDEDNGSMSAWYIFAMLGFYPTCPGKSRYIAVAPMVDAVIHTSKWDVVLKKGIRYREKYYSHLAFGGDM